MNSLKFLWYVLRNGSISFRSIDFAKKRKTILQDVQRVPQQGSLITRSKLSLLRIPILGPLLENISYLVKARKLSRKYFFANRPKLGYVRILKTGSTSVLKAILPVIDDKLKAYDLTDDQVDELASTLESRSFKNTEEFDVFTVVRNPHARLVSAYLDLFNSKAEFVYRNILFGVFKNEMTFPEFVEVISIIPDDLLPPHFRIQNHILNDCPPKVVAYRLEHDWENLNTFFNAFGVSLGHRNKSHDYDYKTFYNQKTAAMIFNKYKEDFDSFGYAKDNESLMGQLND